MRKILLLLWFLSASVFAQIGPGGCSNNCTFSGSTSLTNLTVSGAATLGATVINAATLTVSSGAIVTNNASGTNISGGSATWTAGLSTGSATGGAFVWNSSYAGASGTSQNAATQVMKLDPGGGLNNGPAWTLGNGSGNTSGAIIATYSAGTFGIWSTTNAITSGNFTLRADGSNTLINATGTGSLQSSASTVVTWTSTAVKTTVPFTAGSGTAITAGGSATTATCFSSTSGFCVYVGSGAPTISAAQGSLYLRSDGSSTSTRAYINSSSGSGTTWTAITTAT